MGSRSACQFGRCSWRFNATSRPNRRLAPCHVCSPPPLIYTTDDSQVCNCGPARVRPFLPLATFRLCDVCAAPSLKPEKTYYTFLGKSERRPRESTIKDKSSVATAQPTVSGASFFLVNFTGSEGDNDIIQIYRMSRYNSRDMVGVGEAS